MKDPSLRWIWPRPEFFPDRPVNQFPGWLKDKNSVVISGEFTGSVDYLMGLAGAAESGAVSNTHCMPIDDLFGIYHLLSDKWYRVPSRGEEPKRGCKFS
jgi:hypothetical protein